ncbi:hypothetical protein Tco_1043129 [Tanacetum coccineum]|uniref:Uncharacterized protein n=1 Tax=Tanacetum coccineum TaxID=301880 RepID=A0ABQ5GLS2_9ASTR
MEFSSEVARRLKEQIQENENKPRKIKKIIKYPDTKVLENSAKHDFLENLKKKTFPTPVNLQCAMSKRSRSTRGQASSSREETIEEKVRKFGLFDNENHQMNYNNIVRRFIHSGDVVAWEFLSNKVQTELYIIETLPNHHGSMSGHAYLSRDDCFTVLINHPTLSFPSLVFIPSIKLMFALSTRLLACSTWIAFGGNTYDLDSIWEEMDKNSTLHKFQYQRSTQWLETASQSMATASGGSSDGVRILVTVSEVADSKET